MRQQTLATPAVTPVQLRVPQRAADNYRDWLQRKIDRARVSMRAGQGIPNDEIEAEFAARRRQAAAEADHV